MAYIDLHRHLEGSITPFVAKRVGLDIRCLWNPTVDFFRSWRPIIEAIDSPSICERVAYHSLDELARRGTIYVEYMISPAEFVSDASELVEAIYRGLKRGGTDFGIDASLIYNVTRHFPNKVEQDLKLAVDLFEAGLIAGVGLAGDERKFPIRRFFQSIESRLPTALPRSFHAGEFAGTEEIRDAVLLGANRIGHGLCVVEDRSLLETLRTRMIGIEVCLTSELKLGNVSDLSSHPVFALAREGLRFNLNTDDPAVFGTEIDNEYRLVEKAISSTTITQNAIEMAFASDAVKARLRPKAQNAAA